MLQLLWADPRWPRPPILDPTLGEVEVAIDSLNGIDATELVLEWIDDDDDELVVSLVVSGGAHGLYLLSWRDVVGDMAYDAMSPLQTGAVDRVQMISGGQAGAWRRNVFVDRGSVLAAAAQFVDDRRRCTALNWVRI